MDQPKMDNVGLTEGNVWLRDSPPIQDKAYIVIQYTFPSKIQHVTEKSPDSVKLTNASTTYHVTLSYKNNCMC